MLFKALLSSYFIGLYLCIAAHGATTYWVDNSHEHANDTNPGTDPDAPLESIDAAASKVVAGDTVYVRGSNQAYGTFNVHASGTEGSPIAFIGYTHTPGDLDAGEHMPYDYADIEPWSGIPSTVSPHRCPLITAGGYSSGNGIAITGDWVVVKNMWVHVASRGVLCLGDNCRVQYIYVSFTGNYDIFDGRGITLYGCTQSRVLDCVCYNAGQQVYEVRGNSYACHVIGSRCFSNDIRNEQQGTPNNKYAESHYYFLIEGSSNCFITNCVAERHRVPTVHGGHGFVIQQNSTNSSDGIWITGCSAKNIKDAYPLGGWLKIIMCIFARLRSLASSRTSMPARLC